MRLSDHLSAPIPMLNERLPDVIYAGDSLSLIRTDGQIFITGKFSGPLKWQQTIGELVSDYAIQDGSWPVEISGDEQSQQIYWLYPFSARVHVWRCERGVRKGALDLGPAEAEEFLRNRSQTSPIFSAKLLLAGKRLDDWELEAVACNCGLESIYASIAASDSDQCSTLRLHLDERVLAALNGIDWASIDLRIRAMVARLRPFLETIIKASENYRTAWSPTLLNRISLCATAMRWTAHRSYSILSDLGMQQLAAWDRPPQKSGYPAFNQQRLLQLSFNVSTSSKRRICLKGMNLLRDPRMASSLLYADTLMSSFIQSKSFEEYGRTRGIDTETDWLVALQAGDNPVSSPSVAFQSQTCDQHIMLIPDVYFFIERGYERLRNTLQKRQISWQEKAPQAFWRGSSTGWQEFTAIKRGDLWDSFSRSPRSRLCELSTQIPALLDAKLTAIVQNLTSEDRVSFQKSLEQLNLIDKPVPNVQFADYKFLIDIDGNANSWSLFEKLLMGSCILKASSNWKQWYYGEMREWVHFVPFASDLSDLEERITWCLENDEQAESIASAGKALAESLTYKSQMTAAAHGIITRLDDLCRE